MTKILKNISLVMIAGMFLSWSGTVDDTISTGLQPQLSVDNSGTIRIVFGRSDSIFCATSTDKGESVSKPVLVGYIQGMHLGMTRGPQIASSNKYSIITAIDKSGSIHYFQLLNAINNWEYKGKVNDIPDSAPEGLMSIAADSKDNFYAVWLDIRQGKRNNICYSSLTGKEGKWKKNTLVYISPEEHVCECCRPSIDVRGNKVAIMFRNWIKGSRDLYLITSNDGGKKFSQAQKLGLGTWKLNGCPMDGGGVVVDNASMVHTVWQREGNVYYCKPNETEISLIKGRACSIAQGKTISKNVIINLQDGANVKIMVVNDKKEINIGKGSFLKSIVTNNEEVFCVWEQDKKIMYKKVSTPFSNNRAKVIAYLTPE